MLDNLQKIAGDMAVDDCKMASSEFLGKVALHTFQDDSLELLRSMNDTLILILKELKEMNIMALEEGNIIGTHYVEKYTSGCFA